MTSTDGREEAQPGDDRVCRICQEQGDASDLRRPCQCRGSVAWVHGACLEQWITPTIERSGGRPPVCELCKGRIHIAFRHPHDGLVGFLFGRQAPPVVARAWLALVWCAATACLYLVKHVFLVKAAAWLVSAGAAYAMAAHSRRRGTGPAEPGRAADRICGSLNGLPALGFVAMLCSVLLWGGPFSPFGSATPVSWRDTELVALSGVYVAYLLGVAWWSVSCAARGLALLVTVGFNIKRAWEMCESSVRAWFVIVSMGSAFVAFWVTPSCTAKLAVFAAAVAVLAVLGAAALAWSADFATASALFLAAFYLLVISSGFVLTFAGAFRPARDHRRPTLTDAVDILAQLRHDELSAVQASHNRLLLVLPDAGTNVSGVVASGDPHRLPFDTTVPVWDRLDFGCNELPVGTSLLQHSLLVVDEGECPASTKAEVAAREDAVGVLVAGRVIGQLGDVRVFGANVTSDLPVILLPWSDAWVLRHAIGTGRCSTVEPVLPSSPRSVPYHSPFDLELLSHLETVLHAAAGTRERPLFSDGREVVDVPGSTESDRIVAALARYCGGHSDCVLRCPHPPEHCAVVCSGARSPCSLANYCRFGSVGPCQYVSVIHYVGLTLSMYGCAVLAAVGMLLSALLLQIRDWLVRHVGDGGGMPHLPHIQQLQQQLLQQQQQQQQQQPQPQAAVAGPPHFHLHAHLDGELHAAEAGPVHAGAGQQQQQPQDIAEEIANSEELWVVMLVFVSYVCIIVNAFSTSLGNPQRAATGLITAVVVIIPLIQMVLSIAAKYPTWRTAGEGIIILDAPEEQCASRRQQQGQEQR